MKKYTSVMDRRAVKLREKLYHNLAFVLHENGGETSENMSAANCVLQNIVEKPEILTQDMVYRFEEKANVEGGARADIMASVMFFAFELKKKEPEFFNNLVAS